DKQSFYIGKNKQVIYLAVIDGGSAQLTRDDEAIEGIKLNELVVMLSKDKEELIEDQLFRFYPKLPMEKVTVSSEGNLPYELNFKNNSTLPKPIQGISVHKDLQGKFFSSVSQIRIKKKLTYSE